MAGIFDKFISNPVIREYFVQKIGEEGLYLVEILFETRKYISEFVLAEQSGIYVNTVRSLLYKLYENKIVSYSRKREKTRGWYIYSWMIHLDKLFDVLIKERALKVKGLKRKISEPAGEQQFYCKKCDVKLSFSNAMEYNFSCPSCYEPMIVYSEKILSKQKKDEMDNLESEIKGLEEVQELVMTIQKPEKRKKAVKKQKKAVKAKKVKKAKTPKKPAKKGR